MPGSEKLTNITNDVTAATTVVKSATILIEGFKARLAAAIENGATAEELAPVSDLSDALEAETNKLAAAVAANTPGA